MKFLVKPSKTDKPPSITYAWKQLYNIINHTSATPKSWILDYETSHHLQHAMREKHSISFQLVPPHNRKVNLAEQAIQTFKNHLKTELSTVQPDFPIAEWDR